MWFVSKKKYDAMIAERDNWKQIAERAVAEMCGGRIMFVSWKKLCKIAQHEAEAWRKIAAGKEEYIEELLNQIKDLYDKRANMYNYCCELKREKEELEARLDFVTEQRDYYYNLLKDTDVHVGL